MMMNLQEKKSDSNATNEEKKTCSDCFTSRTPLWRGGPAGPKSLCNACGIKYNKKRRALLGLVDGGLKDKTKKKQNNKKSGNSKSKMGEKIKLRVMALGREIVFQRLGKQRRNLGEEEKAAILLMALSSGSFYA